MPIGLRTEVCHVSNHRQIIKTAAKQIRNKKAAGKISVYDPALDLEPLGVDVSLPAFDRPAASMKKAKSISKVLLLPNPTPPYSN